MGQVIHNVLMGFFLKTYFYFIYLGVLPAQMSKQHMDAMPVEARRGQQIPETGIRAGLGPSCWVLGTKSQVFFPNEPSALWVKAPLHGWLCSWHPRAEPVCLSERVPHSGVCKSPDLTRTSWRGAVQKSRF